MLENYFVVDTFPVNGTYHMLHVINVKDRIRDTERRLEIDSHPKFYLLLYRQTDTPTHNLGNYFVYVLEEIHQQIFIFYETENKITAYF